MAFLCLPLHTHSIHSGSSRMFTTETQHTAFLKMLSIGNEWIQFLTVLRNEYSQPRKRTWCWQNRIWYTVCSILSIKTQKQINYSLVMAGVIQGKKFEGSLFESIHHHTFYLLLITVEFLVTCHQTEQGENFLIRHPLVQSFLKAALKVNKLLIHRKCARNWLPSLQAADAGNEDFCLIMLDFLFLTESS